MAMIFQRKNLRLARTLIRHALGLGFYARPDITCYKERHGSDYGGWWLQPKLLNDDSIIYSVGVGTDISFDLSIIKNLGVSVHAFDPTPKSIDWLKKQEKPDRFVFHDIGVAHYDGFARFYAPKNAQHVSHSMISQDNVGDEAIEVRVCSLQTIMKELAHDRIDVLKIDIEGAEYSLIDQILEESIPVQQLLVEFHHRVIPDGVKMTKKTVQKMRESGYRIFAVSENGEEFSFVKLD
ncbi:FkbM family methyltransferase [Candidatus Viridilinea mediisalina]|uniref:Methyltransferase FkbM domain-containing protein n=1 Tax=Candidatus Viridilinea mediisalina TaxID=2024553 RepID=A0A2A6RFW7_9CHLR|nr:FkbM family methyltransferase [Candidatus Viridilinea mediisalina]PDW02024.1 hypothetical protein CJ255_16105 [Candidatus Viridilinea mediisalina]